MKPFELRAFGPSVLSLALVGLITGCTMPGAGTVTASGLVIEQVAFDLLPGFSGGWVTYDPVPVVLFEDGTLCDCSDENLATLDLEALADRRPGALGEWRGFGDSIEVKWDDEWRDIGFDAVALQLGEDWAGSGTYERMDFSGGAGTGVPLVVAAHDFTFHDSGTFELDGIAYADTVVPTDPSTAERTGHYSIQGWMMELDFADGNLEQITALTSEDAPDAALWLSGSAYTHP